MQHSLQIHIREMLSAAGLRHPMDPLFLVISNHRYFRSSVRSTAVGGGFHMHNSRTDHRQPSLDADGQNRARSPQMDTFPVRSCISPSFPSQFIQHFVFVVCRFLFTSGAVKVISRCPKWWTLTAMEIHFETLPLPTVFAYFAHNLPASTLKAFNIFMLASELAVPWLFFFPHRTLRRAVFYWQVNWRPYSRTQQRVIVM